MRVEPTGELHTPDTKSHAQGAQIAIARFFDGEPPDPVSEPPSSPPVPQDRRRQENLMSGLSTSARRTRGSGFEPAPRVVPQPESSLSQPGLAIWWLVSFPFNALYKILSKSANLLLFLFPFLPRFFSRLSPANSRQASRINTTGRRPLNPRDTAARFIREFEEEYGSHELPFFENGYAQAYDTAKRELKYLLVVLLSSEHDDTSSYVRDTLLSSAVVQFLKDPQNNIILWAGNVQDSEAYQVSTALNCTKLPFTGLIVHTPSVSSTAMSVIARLTGPTSPSVFISKLRTAISQNSEALNRARAARAEQQATRNLREAQNSAYERSLAQDRERLRQRREAQEARERAEREARERSEAKRREEQALEQWRRWRAQSIPAEPGQDTQDSVRISVRMPSGARVVRRFGPDASLEDLYAFVECYSLLQSGEPSEETVEKPAHFSHTYGFRLVSPMPREVYELDSAGTIKERIGRSGNLIVETLSGDEEEEDAEPC